MIDLWPDDIGELKLKSPAAILREQASLLGKKTLNLVEAEVETWRPDYSDEGEFYYTFSLVAPTLGGYRYNLFGIHHDIELYPVEFSCHGEILDEISPGAEELVAHTEEEFTHILAKVLGARRTRRVIQALLAQAEPREYEPPF